MPTDKEQKWGPEPWRLGTWTCEESGDTYPEIRDAKGGHIWLEGAMQPDDNFERLIACVNACSGMSDPERQVGELKRLLAEAVETNAGHPAVIECFVEEAKSLLADLEGK